MRLKFLQLCQNIRFDTYSFTNHIYAWDPTYQIITQTSDSWLHGNVFSCHHVRLNRFLLDAGEGLGQKKETNTLIVGCLNTFQYNFQLPCQLTCTNLRMRRLKRPMSCELGSSISFSSLSTVLCCNPIPSSNAWRRAAISQSTSTGNLLWPQQREN